MERRFCSADASGAGALARGESGVVLVLAMLILIAILTVAAFALDVGNLFRARIVMQNAADAASIATVNYVALHGRLNLEQRWGITSASPADLPPTREARQESLSNQLRPLADSLVRANMAMAGLSHQDAFPIELVSPTGFEFGQAGINNSPVYKYTVALQRRIEFLLIHVVPFQGGYSSRQLAAVASAQRGPINISLVLDVSDSMNCPRDATQPCNCLRPQAGTLTPACPPEGERRLDDLMQATAEFLKLFELDRDGITLVPFNISARARPIRSQMGIQGLAEEFGVDPSTITSAQVDAFVELLARDYKPHSATNICDALTQAWALSDGLHPEQATSYVLFTDGAPTAARFLFSEAAATARLAEWDGGYLPDNSSGSQHFDNRLGSYDYMHYTLQWLDPSITFRAGPSLLVESGHLFSSPRSDSYNPAVETPAAPVRPAPPGCSDGLQRAPRVDESIPVSSAAQEAFSCLRSLESHLPRQPEKRYGGNYNAADGTLSAWREQYYNCAIELSDFIRSSSGTIHVVGLGAGSISPAADPLQDAYQDIDDNWGRKDVFSTRLALDFARRNPAHQDFNYQGYQGYEALGGGAGATRAGAYYPTHNSADIRLLFSKIGRGLLLKLVH